MEKHKKHGKWFNSILWTLGSSSPAICYMLTAQLSFALTESFSMAAATVGMIFLVSRIFDGFTDIVAGIIIDRTHSKLGKARVWDLCMVFAWIAVILCFTVPRSFSNVGKIIYVFIMNNLYTSIFSTFTALAETIRLKNSMDEEGRVHAIAVSGVVTTLLSVLVSTCIPIMISIWGSLEYGWTIIALIIGIPCIIFTILRFILMPELPSAELSEEQNNVKMGFVESAKLLLTNKYTIIIFIIAFIRALVITATGSAGTYYFTYVYGDVAAASIPGLISMVTFIGAAFLPVLTRKLGNAKTVMYSIALAGAGYLLRYLMPLNLVWYTGCSIIAGLCSIPLSYLLPVMLIDVMEYNTLTKGHTPEAVFAAARSIADKIGLGLGSAVTGFILQFGALPNGGYTAGSIKFLNNGFPAIGFFIAAIVLIFFDLDKKLPEMRNKIG